MTGDKYYTHLFTIECMDTGFTIARYINKHRYDSRYHMLNKVALDLWIYGEDGNGFGVPRNAFFTPDPTDDIQKLRQIGRKDGMIWAGSDLKPGKFLFPDCLDFTKKDPGMQGHFPSHLRISEKAFLHKNFIRSETGYAPHQLVYGSTSGLPGIF